MSFIAGLCVALSVDSRTVSPLWALTAFRSSFFKRLGICWLHVELQGLWKSHLSALLSDLSPGELDGVASLFCINYIIEITHLF